MTKRPQNVCGSCGYTWYPRGKSVSLKCPKCGGGKVKIAGGGVFLAILAFVFFSSTHHDKDASQVNESTVTSSQSAQVAQEQAIAPLKKNELPVAPPVQESTSTKPAEALNEDDTTPPGQKCEVKKDSFVSWNNCMWNECSKPQFKDLEECKNKQGNKVMTKN